MKNYLLLLMLMFVLSIASCDKNEINDEVYDIESTDKGELEEEDITPPN